MKKHLKKLALKKLVFVFWKFFLSKHSFRSVCFSFGTIGRTKSFQPLKKHQKGQKQFFLQRSHGSAFFCAFFFFEKIFHFFSFYIQILVLDFSNFSTRFWMEGEKKWKKKTFFKSKNAFSFLFFSLNLKGGALLFI